MKKIVALICLIVLSVQVLPVQQIGSLLGSNTINEELPHNFSTEKADDLKFENASCDISALLHISSETQSEAYIHFASSIPDNHQGEIQTPPPNIV